MPLINKEVLNFEIDVDPKSGIANVRKFDREFMRSLQDVRKTMTALDKAQKGYFNESRNAWREVQDEVRATAGAIRSFDADIAEAIFSIQEIEDALKDAADGTKQLSDAEVLRHKRAIELLREQISETETARETLRDIGNQTVTIKMEAAADALKESLTKVADPFSRLLSKDIGGAFESGGKLAGSALESSVRNVGKRMTMSGVGSGISRWGTSLATKGKADMSAFAATGARKAGGGAMVGIGKVAQVVGGLVGKLGPMLQMAAKFGPILGTISSLLVGLVKLMIDADSQAKEFQKDLLASASTGEYMARNGRVAGAAYEDLKETVTDIRNASFSLQKNLEWGTTSKEHLAFWNTLNQEGVSIKRMKEEFEHAKDAGEDAGDAVEHFGEMTATAVAYSRSFGVSLNDIVSYQAEVMTELGASYEKVTKDFAFMAAGASESGMAMNKFFAIMRGVSSDLSLYNMRMEDAVTLLKKLGTVMSPKSAQKFMQTLTQGFKGMGRLEKLRMTLLAGQDKTAKIVEKNLGQREQTLAKQVQEATKRPMDEVVAAVQQARAGKSGALKDMIKGLEGEGTLREAAIELSVDTKMSKKGLFGLSQSIGNLTGGGMLEMTKAALGRFAKPGSSLADMSGELGPEMMAENLGISQEQLKSMIKLEAAIDDERKALVESGKSAEEVAKMSDDDILQSLGMNEKDVKDLMKNEKDFAKEQTSLTTSMLDKLGILTDFLMNQVYEAMTGIWDAVIGIWDKIFGGSAAADAKRKREMSKEIMGSKNTELIKAWTESGGDTEKMKGALAGGSFGQTFGTNVKRMSQLMTVVEEGAKKFGDEAEAAGQDRKEAESQYRTRAWSDIRGIGKDTGAMKAWDAAKDFFSAEGSAGAARAAKMGGIDQAKIDKLVEGMNKGGTVTSSMASAGFTPEEMARVMERAAQAAQDTMHLIDLVKKGTGPVATSALPTEGDFATARGFSPAPSSRTWGVGLASISSMASGGSGIVEPPKPTSYSATAGSHGGGGGGGGGTAVTPPATGGGGEGVASPANVASNAKTTAESTEKLAATSANMLATNEDLLNAARQQGIKMDKSFLKSPFGKQMEDSTYDAMSKALFEYWLYSAKEEDVKAVMKRIREQGGTAFDAASARKASTEHFAGTEEGRVLASHAGGGIVTGVSGGIAMTKPLAAPGEGLLSVGPHEAILPINKLGPGAAAPAGGGKSSLALDVNINGTTDPDFQRGLKTAVTNYIYEYERRKRVT